MPCDTHGKCFGVSDCSVGRSGFQWILSVPDDCTSVRIAVSMSWYARCLLVGDVVKMVCRLIVWQHLLRFGLVAWQQIVKSLLCLAR